MQCSILLQKAVFSQKRSLRSPVSLLLSYISESFLFSHHTPSRLHNDGRMLDVFQRLTAKEGVYFLPQDLELSNQELSYIVKKAEQWRGFNGERRKVDTLLVSFAVSK